MEILRIENLSFKYPGADTEAIRNVNISFERGSFNLLCGCSGCGKTTLLKLLKPELSPIGELRGEAFLNGISIKNIGSENSAARIGFVMQNPENQIVTDKVWHELAFGLESLGYPQELIRSRVAETASYFGIESWFEKNTYELSGGQKQLLNLAAVTAMQPDIIILDEPTSRLDPIAATEFIGIIQRMNRELSVTVIIAEHRLEELLPICDTVLVMESGQLLISSPPEKALSQLKAIDRKHPILNAFPTAARIYDLLGFSDKPPLTVRDGRAFIENNFSNEKQAVYRSRTSELSSSAAVELKSICFRYERSSPNVIRNASLKVYEGEKLFLLGGNGAGKTTLLSIIAGLERIYSGAIEIFGKNIKAYKANSLYRDCLSLLPQEPQSIFLGDTVKEDMEDMLKKRGADKASSAERISAISRLLNIEKLLNSNPLDLSGGEQQKCAIAKVLLTEPRLLLLDEPTKGLDAKAKVELADIINSLSQNGITVISVTHDVEFAAENADRCAMLFNGEIFSCSAPTEFFGENAFYTTAASRISRFTYKNAVTASQVVELCLENGEKNA